MERKKRRSYKFSLITQTFLKLNNIIIISPNNTLINLYPRVRNKKMEWMLKCPMGGSKLSTRWYAFRSTWCRREIAYSVTYFPSLLWDQNHTSLSREKRHKEFLWKIYIAVVLLSLLSRFEAMNPCNLLYVLCAKDYLSNVQFKRHRSYKFKAKELTLH